ncbi:hypothetical protein [Flavobacterium reichenbachii]|uniref:Uncharacterized protein n=1 Tax=Flavobacterium reichenbachii TaxID=362418 RepID=A0A085ZDV7_9FLAO|nr:hypothetical protein [Flavobacterium reichenbachii]KFF02621.1 hypothetical protein IW19_23430 [Flavobacterium reichenbachii]OXB11117.1 hypothetical protein B0A68_21060 [Flavobacterium reichenbachii]
MNFRYIILIILIGSFAFCTRKDSNFEPDLINKLSEDYTKPISLYSTVPLFVSTDNNMIIETNSSNLAYIYKMYYTKSYDNFGLFLNDILNNEIELHEANFSKTQYEIFSLNDSIKKIYQQRDFNAFFKDFTTFSTSKDENYILKKDNLNHNQQITVSYYLFKNKYHIKIDDIRGNYYIVSRKQLFYK